MREKGGRREQGRASEGGGRTGEEGRLGVRCADSAGWGINGAVGL